MRWPTIGTLSGTAVGVMLVAWGFVLGPPRDKWAAQFDNPRYWIFVVARVGNVCWDGR